MSPLEWEKRGARVFRTAFYLDLVQPGTLIDVRSVVVVFSYAGLYATPASRVALHCIALACRYYLVVVRSGKKSNFSETYYVRAAYWGLIMPHYICRIACPILLVLAPMIQCFASCQLYRVFVVVFQCLVSLTLLAY